MSSTDEIVSRERKAQEIEARLREIAPYPAEGAEPTAENLARYLAVCAHLGWTRNITPFIRDDQEIPASLVCAQFAAARALYVLIGTGRENAAAREIADAWDDGQMIGELLHDQLRHLGVDPEEVARLDAARLELDRDAGACGCHTACDAAIAGLQSSLADTLADRNDLAHLNTSQASLIRDLRAALSSLADRAEASKAITGDEADEYRRLAVAAVPAPEADRG